MSVLNGDIQKKKRKPHTRASKACEVCRQQKTRCLRTDSSVSCLRCISLKLDCSLISDSNIRTELISNANNINIVQSTSQSNNYNKPVSAIPSAPPLQHQFSFDPNSTHILPSINNHVSNTIYERLQTQQGHQPNIISAPASSNNTFQQRYNNEPIQQLYVPSPRLQPFIQHSPLSTFPTELVDNTDNKLDLIHNNIKQILDMISSNNNNSNDNNLNIQLSSINSHNKDLLPILSEPVNITNISTQYHALAPINFLKTLTEKEIDNNSNEISSLPLCIQQQLYPLHTFRPPYEDIISTEILTLNQTVQLIDIFRDRYGRWLSFPSLISTKKLIKRFRIRCPLLLTVSCFLSLKYGDPLLKQRVWSKIYNVVVKEIHWLTSTYSGSLEELQCLVILSAYSCGLSDTVYNNINNNTNKNTLLLLDGWHLSGVGLTLFEKINGYGMYDQMYGEEIENLWKKNKNIIETKIGKFNNQFNVHTPSTNNSTPNNTTNNTTNISINNRNDNDNTNTNNNNNKNTNNNDTNDNDDNNNFDINNDPDNNANNNELLDDDVEEEDDNDEFNLLTLHRIWNTLVLVQLAYCLLYGRKSWIGLDRLKPREVSDIASSTNFDFRIISEIHIYILGYRHILLNEKYSDINKGIKIWYDKWGFTFGQPSNQFIEIDYHFVQALIKIKQIKLDINSILFINSELNISNFEKVPDLLDLKLHTSAIVNLISTVNDDSYFAFLSDQIHLTIFYATNILISVISILNKTKLHAENIQNKNEINDDDDDELEEIIEKSKIKNYANDKDIIKKIQTLIFRYRTVATTNDDAYFKYYDILEKNYVKKLLDYV